MMAAAIRILYVDDESSLLDIGKLFLERSGDFQVTTAMSAPEGIRLLEEEKFDAIISDYQMPGMDGIQFLVEVRSRFGPIPFILFTGRGREEVVIQAINSGVDFYLQKGGEPGAQFAELTHKVRQAASRKNADDALRKSEEKYRHVIEHSDEAIAVAQDGMLRLVNHRAVEFTGYSEQELLSMPFSAVIHPDDRVMVVERFQKRLKGEELPCRYAFRLSVKDGSTRWVEISVVAIDWDGRPATLNFFTDITERKRDEEALIIQHDLSIVLNHYTSLNDAFNQILSAALKIEGLDVGGIYQADPVTGALDIVAHLGLSPEFIAHTSHFDASSPQVQRARTGVPFFGPYSEIRPHGKDEIREKELVTALASIPVMHEGKLISVLNLASHTVNEIPVSTRHTLETLAMQVGSALVRIRSRKELEESEARYRNVVEDQTEFICRFLPDGTHVFVNEAYCRYFGLNQKEIIGTRFQPLIHPDDLKSVARLIASLTPEHPNETIDQRIIMPDGSTRWQRWVDRVIFHGDGSLKEYQSVGRDITETKQVEERLRESDEQLHLSIEGANLGLWDINLLTGEMVHNQRWAEMLGFSMEELKKPSEWWGLRVHPDDYQNVLNLSNLHRAGKVPFFEAVYRMKHKNGEWRWVHSQGKIITRDSTGVPLRLIGINNDITGQKRAEEELRANLDELTRQEQALRISEEKYRKAFFTSPNAICITRLHDGMFISINKGFTEITGYTEEDVIGKTSLEINIWKDPEDRRKIVEGLKAYGEVRNYEARFLTKTGEIYGTMSTSIIELNGVPHILNITSDITERKQAEEALLKNAEELHAANEEITATEEELRANLDELTRQELELRESEKKYRTVFENTGTATVVLEESGIISLANEEFAQLCGFSKDAIEGKKNWTEFVVKEDLERMHVQHRLRRQDETKALTHYEFRFVTKSGDIRNIYLSVSVIPGTKKSVASLLDITDRKLAEELYQTIFENTGTAMIILEEDTTISHVNEEMEKIWGYSKEEIEGRVKWPTLVAAEDLQKMLEYHRLRRTDPGSAPRNYEFRYIHKNKKLLDGTLTASMIPGTKKSVISLADITEIKKTEQALRESEERLNFALESAHLGLWDLDFVSYEVVHNRQWTEMLGFSSAEMDKPSSWWQERVHPDDSAFVSKSNEDHVAGRAPYFDCIYRMKHENGSWIWVHSQGKVVSRDINGQPLRMIGINQDITERKRAEDALRIKNTVFESSIAANSIADNQGIITSVNPAFLLIWGYRTKEDAIGKPIYSFFAHEKDAAPVLEALDTFGRWVGEFTALRVDGSSFIAFGIATVIRDETGKQIGYQSTLLDITGRKVAEEALQQANKKLTLLSSLTRHDINNQLTVLMAYLDILEQKLPDPALTEYFLKLSTAAQRISSMIQFTKQYECIGINAPAWQDCRTLVNTAAKDAPLGKIMVKNVLPDGAEVFADPLIVKVFYNLMDNAVRYGGKCTTISFSVEERDDDHLIVCEDDGEGVAAEEKERIFERGFGKNTGLGLALSREILDITGITIRETGESDKGARFEMTVPKGAYRLQS